MRQFFTEVRRMNISVYAANACFFLVLAVFPGMLLMVGILRYTQLDVDALMRLVEGILPSAFLEKARRMILLTWEKGSGRVLSLSAVTALWSAALHLHSSRKEHIP